MDKARKAGVDLTDRLLDVTDRDAISDAIEEINNLRNDVDRLKKRITNLEAQLAAASWKAEYDRHYYETKPQETW